MPTISHHYLPQVYLRRFTLRESRKLLWEYDKTTGAVTESSPKKCGCEDYYHAFKKDNGTLDTDSIEQDLARIETNIEPVYEAIRMQRPLNQTEWRAFQVFAGSMSVRVPAFINNFHDHLSEVMGHAFEITKHSPDFIKRAGELGVSRESLANYRATADRDFSLLLCLQAMDTPIRLFSEMSWQFLHAPAPAYFITGDNPVFHCAPARDQRTIYPPGLADKDIEVTFPLSRAVCAIGTWHASENLYRPIDAKTVEVINSRTAGAAKRYLYGPRRDAKVFARPATPPA